MRIGGLQRFTLSDFPGHCAAIVFTQGCNMRCPFCHNGALLAAPQRDGLIGEAEVMEFLTARRGRLSGVVVSGGEPTLQPDLLGFLRALRGLGFAIKLDTNGSRPEVLADVLTLRLADFVAMDIKAPFDKYPQLCGVSGMEQSVRESMALISWSGVAHEFRTTLAQPLLGHEDSQAIAAQLPPGARYRVQPFIRENALDPALRAPQPAAPAALPSAAAGVA